MKSFVMYHLTIVENGFIVGSDTDNSRWVFTSRFDALVFLSECMLKLRPESQPDTVEIRKIAYNGDAPAAK